MALESIQQLVDDLVRDKDQVISLDTRDAAVQAALARYAADAPRVVVEDLDTSAGDILPMPAFWGEGSQLRALEHPAGQNPPRYLPLTAVSLYVGPAGSELRLSRALAGPGMLRVTYTAAHSLSTAGTSVPARHWRPLACLAAADLCDQLAGYYATEGAPSIGADTVDHQSKTEKFRRLARDYRSQYTQAVGSAPSDRNRPGSAQVALPSRDSLGGRRLFHPPSSWPRG